MINPTNSNAAWQTQTELTILERRKVWKNCIRHLAGGARLLWQGRAHGDEEGGRVLQDLEWGGRLWQVVGRPGGNTIFSQRWPFTWTIGDIVLYPLIFHWNFTGDLLYRWSYPLSSFEQTSSSVTSQNQTPSGAGRCFGHIFTLFLNTNGFGTGLEYWILNTHCNILC